MAAAGDFDRAEALARSITDPGRQAQALADLASVAEPARARPCIVGAFAVGRWTIPLAALARVDSVVLSVFADELAGLRGDVGVTG